MGPSKSEIDLTVSVLAALVAPVPVAVSVPGLVTVAGISSPKRRARSRWAVVAGRRSRLAADDMTKRVSRALDSMCTLLPWTLPLLIFLVSLGSTRTVNNPAVLEVIQCDSQRSDSAP